MSKKNNIIEINGKRYEATTGALLSHSSSAPHPAKPKAQTTPQPAPQHVPPKPSPRTTKPISRNISRQPAKPVRKHSPEASRTLMRHAVKKPSTKAKQHLKAQGHTDHLVKQPLSRVIVKPSVNKLNKDRLRHAKTVSKSSSISRFSLAPPTGSSYVSVRQGSAGRAKVTTPAFAPRVGSHEATASHHQTAAHITGHHQKTTSSLLENALNSATSHHQLAPKRPAKQSRRGAGIAGVIVLSMVILGVIITQNLSDVRLQMASAKAGFTASLPDYRPSGYSLADLDYSNGVITTRFSSNSDDRRYSITQKRSSWDKTTLLGTLGLTKDSQYQAVESKGRTIYLYGNRNATWLNKGIWYQIQTNNALTDHQIVKLADSL